MNKKMQAHIIAFTTIFIWGTTFVSTKLLLNILTPIEILFLRFLLGYLVLWLMAPRILPFTSKKRELYFAGAGLTGVTLYFLLENIALTHTYASNVGVIVSIAPFFTALFSVLLLKSPKPRKNFYLGFLVAIVGILMITFQSGDLHVSPIGDLLAVLAAAVWGIYAVLGMKIGQWGYGTIEATRRMFFYGLLFMLPCLPFMGFHVELSFFQSWFNVMNLLFLGIGASALCFVMWNYAVKVLGALQTSVYIYLIPVVTVIFSFIFLGESVGILSILGMILTIGGLFISER